MTQIVKNFKNWSISNVGQDVGNGTGGNLAVSSKVECGGLHWSERLLHMFTRCKHTARGWTLLGKIHKNIIATSFAIYDSKTLEIDAHR